MCDPITLTVLAVTSAVIGGVVHNKQMSAQRKAIKAGDEAQNEQIADAAGAELDKRSREARQERAAARVSAAESGINLGSNSFLAQLQASEIAEEMDTNLIEKDTSNRQKARQAETSSRMASATNKSALAIGLDAAVAGVGAYTGAGGKPYLGGSPGRG